MPVPIHIFTDLTLCLANESLGESARVNRKAPTSLAFTRGDMSARRVVVVME